MASEIDMDTQTQSQSNEISEDFVRLGRKGSVSWGQLISQNSSLENHDLIDTEFAAGRHTTSSCVFDNKLPKKMLLQLSKRHFRINKDLSDRLNPVYIEDLSRNGTYVNQQLIGTGKKRILNNNDVISVVHPACEVYQFVNLHINSYCADMPDLIKNKYHIGARLGAGACGTVYLVYDYKTCEQFALKQIKKNQLNGYKKDRANNEGDIMRDIKHPCIIKMLSIDDVDDSIFITLELMKGGDLLTRITSNVYLDEKISKLFFYQMCHAIKYLHDRKIAHRDLKPDNILLSSSDRETTVKISDFGLSKFVASKTLLRTMCGTPHYVAPEVLLTEGVGAYTEKVDIWSLGVVLFTCLSGTLPFSNDYGTPAQEQIKKAAFRFRSANWGRVSTTAKQLVRSLLTNDVERRPSIDQLLADRWFDDHEMKVKAHKIMKIAAPVPPPRSLAINKTPVFNGNFAVPYNVAEIKPKNDEHAQAIKKRRIN